MRNMGIIFTLSGVFALLGALSIARTVWCNKKKRQNPDIWDGTPKDGKKSYGWLKRPLAFFLAAVVFVSYGGSVWAQDVIANRSAQTVSSDAELAAYKGINDRVVSELAKAQKEAEVQAAADKAKEEKDQAQATVEAQFAVALNVRNSEGEDGNYIAPAIISDEEWNLLFGKMNPYARRDSLPTMQIVRNHICDFANPVGLPLIADYAWIEARFLGLARDDATAEVKAAAKKGATLNILDVNQLNEAFKELDEKLEEWQKEFDEMSKEEQTLKLKMGNCEIMMNDPIAAEEWLQYFEMNTYIMDSYGDVMKDIRKYFDDILEPRDADGNLIPLEEAQNMGLGWNLVYEYADGHNKEDAYLRVKEEHRKKMLPLVQIWLDFTYVGVTDKDLHRNWELKSGQITSFLKTSLAKLIDTKDSYQFDLLGKDGKTVMLSTCINCKDSRLGEFGGGKKTVPIQPGEPTYVPPKRNGGGGGGTTTTTIDKDPVKGSGPQGNAQDLAGANVNTDGAGILDENDPATKHQQGTVTQQPVVSDPNGGNTQGGVAPDTSKPITGGNTNSEATGTDQGTGQTAKPSEEDNKGKVSID